MATQETGSRKRQTIRVDFRPDWRRNPEKYVAKEITIDVAVLCWTPKGDPHNHHPGWAYIFHEGDPRIPNFACSYGADHLLWRPKPQPEKISWMLFVGAHHLVHSDGISPARVRRALMRVSEIKEMSEWYFHV